jgi:hypothetical protein
VQVSGSASTELFLEGSELGDHFVSDELIYGTKIAKVDVEVPVTVRDWLSNYKAGRIWIELDFVPLANIDSYFSAKIQVFKGPLVGSYAKHPDLQFGGFQSKRSVFVDGNKPVKNPERMSLEPIPSLIGLKRFDNRHRGWENVSNLIDIEFPIRTDRKTCLPARASDVKACKTPRKLVKARTKTINKISNEQRDHDRERFALNANDMLLFSRIILSADQIRFRFERGAEFGIDFVQVMFCPNGFQLQVS